MLNFSISGGSNSVPNLVVPTLSEARIPYILTFFKTQYLSRSTCYFIYYRGVTTKGDLRRRNTVTFPIIKFGARFLAQIVENRETRLSRSFLGLGDTFFSRKFITKTWSGWSGSAKLTVPAGHHQQVTTNRSGPVSAVLYGRSVFVITFRKNYLQDLNMV